jgi:hypothetical protein
MFTPLISWHCKLCPNTEGRIDDVDCCNAGAALEGAVRVFG